MSRPRLGPRIRPASGSEGDRRFLREMLYEAAAWRPGPARPSFDRVMSNRQVALYVEGWPCAGDAGVVAEDDAGRALGAAWYRLFAEDEPGYGFIDPSIPEITAAVRSEVRGRGVGTALLEALVERARADGHEALSLSVEMDNPAAHLYERAGFARVGRGENVWTMRLDLDA